MTSSSDFSGWGWIQDIYGLGADSNVLMSAWLEGRQTVGSAWFNIAAIHSIALSSCVFEIKTLEKIYPTSLAASTELCDDNNWSCLSGMVTNSNSVNFSHSQGSV